MREIVDHIVPGAPGPLRICVMDEPGSGGAHHCYRIDGFDPGNNPTAGMGFRTPIQAGMVEINFQNGPIPEKGVNGITVEALIAICEDRLRSFQAGPFPSRENALALTKLEEAMHWLERRTINRLRRGVEGKEVA